jgi:hypothetical protein
MTCLYRKGWRDFSLGKRNSRTGDKRHAETNNKTNLLTRDNKYEDVTWRIISSIRRGDEEKLEDHEYSGHIFMTSFKSAF